jgi:hypothetical protein
MTRSTLLTEWHNEERWNLNYNYLTDLYYYIPEITGNSYLYLTEVPKGFACDGILCFYSSPFPFRVDQPSTCFFTAFNTQSDLFSLPVNS